MERLDLPKSPGVEEESPRKPGELEDHPLPEGKGTLLLYRDTDMETLGQNSSEPRASNLVNGVDKCWIRKLNKCIVLLKLQSVS